MTLDCATPAPTGSTSTALSSASDVATFLNSAAGLSNKITCSAKSGDVYKGKGSGGGEIPQQCLKIGKASGGGSFTFTIPETYDEIDVVELTCYGWKTSSSIKINNGTAQTFTTAQAVTTKTFELASSTRTIAIEVTTSAVCVTNLALKSKTVTHTLTYSATNGSISGVDAESNDIASGASVSEGATVTLTATPSDGYEFSSWEVSGSGSTLPYTSTNPTTFTMGTADATVTANFVVAAAVSSPTFSPASGTAVYYGTKVTASCATDGASLYYTKTTDGSTPTDPTDASTPYPDGGITIDANTVKIKMIAKKGSDYSSVKEATFTLQAPAEPTFSPAEGAVVRGTTITISSAAGTTIYYTTDGSDADTGTDAESNTVNVTIDGPKTIKAIAVDPELNMSSEVTASYSIAQVATPSFSAVGSVTKGTTVSLSSATEGATIYYTRDGSTPTTSSPTYSSAITINFNQTIKAIAVKDNYIDSEVASATYTISGGSMSVTFSEEGYDNATSMLDKSYDNGNVSINWEQGTNGSNKPKYYESGTSARMYSGNTLTISSSTKTISSILFTFHSTNTSLALANDEPGILSDVTSSTRTWTGNATSITFTTTATNYIKSITVTYAASDTRTDCVTNLDLVTKSFAKGDVGVLTTSGTEGGGLTEDLVYTFSSDNDEVFKVLENGTYEAKAVGTSTVTITASPTEADFDDYKAVTAEVKIAVTAPVEVSADDVEMTYDDAAKAIGATTSAGYAATLTYASGNTSIATVDASGNVTAVAAGTTTITISAPADAEHLYTAGEDKEITVTVSAPEGGKTAKTTTPVTVVSQTLLSSTLPTGWTGDGEIWSGNSSYGAVTADGTTGSTYDLKTETINLNGNYSAASVTFQHTGKTFSAPSNACKLYVKDGDTETQLTINTYFTGSDWTYVSNTTTLTSYIGKSIQLIFRYTPASGDQGKWEVKNFSVSATPSPTESVKLNASGYATFCSEYPLDFSDYATDDYSAWEITDISESAGVYTITFNQLTGTIKGGQGILLKGTANATVTLTSNSSTNVLSSNLLEGILAPTYVTAGEYYGLSGQNFVPVAASTVDAGKALLPASALGGGSVKAFNFVFEDNATGIRTVETVSPEEAAQIFDLSGRRLNKIQKGINIVNGKKVLY